MSSDQHILEEDIPVSESDNDENIALEKDSSLMTVTSGSDSSKTFTPSKENNVTIEDAIQRVGMGRFQHRILWAAGLCFAADSMEIFLLSFLVVVLQAQWNLTQHETAFITSSVFLGAMTGTLFLGPLGDKIGRKPVFILTAAIIAVFGLLTATANNLTSVIIMRFFTGFGVGGLTVPFDALAEFIPTSHRGLHLVLVSAFWCFGTTFTPLVAYLILGDGQEGIKPNAWRVFVVVCAIPCLVSTMIGICFVPESPRWLLTKGREEEAMAILRHVAEINGKDVGKILPSGLTLVDEEEHNVKNCCHLLSKQWRKITIFMWIAWVGFAFSYYGCVQVTTLIFSSTNSEINTAGGTTNTYSFDYGAIIGSALSEISASILILLTITHFGRITIQVVAYTVGGLLTFTLCLLAAKENGPRGFMIATAFLARMSYSCGTSMTWISTAEILTTDIRTTGHSVTNAVARLGGASSPFLVNYGTSYPEIGSILLLTSLMTAVAGCFLPETKGKALGNVVHIEDPQLGNVKTSEII